MDCHGSVKGACRVCWHLTKFCIGKTVSSKNLELYRKNLNEFLRRLISMGKTWIYHYTHDNKLESKLWITQIQIPKKAKLILVENKNMAGVFWDYWYWELWLRTIFIDCVEREKVSLVSTSKVFCTFERRDNERNVLICRKKILFHHDIGPAHRLVIAMSKILWIKVRIA